MNFHTLKCWGRRALALAALLVSSHAAAAADPPGKQADVQLKTDLTHMNILVTQGAPLPPGGCVAGYAWHTTYGGCRRAESQPESAACPAGFTGNRTRYRTAYILQANAYDVAYEPWGPWQDSCTASRLSGVVDTLIAAANGAESGETNNTSTLPPNLAKGMMVYYGTRFGVTIHRPSATLNCTYASGTTAGSGNSNSPIWFGLLMAPGESVTRRGESGSFGHCQLSNGNLTAELYGSCDSSTGGDLDYCVGATRVVNITSVNGCTVTTETRQKNTVIDVGSYDICH
ncbi:hypothetical protein N5C72_19525 [Achromobacter mucicolens]|jgi:hypothetical protein|uniref:Secreted protein n=1 Tax=Achromobacter mucicolens TaxID=1389922 RepID=A0ABD4YYN4_9BURK|nr:MULTISPECIES: hypothetical protein [Achromobacter]MDH1180278.1 hypothetical protein [Achromobacter mucicolens]CAB3842291.1 hypothetical protein LMG3415_01511 [Achromobacter mucicolens]